uniref:Cytochrome c oxidase subunit 2 n=1 Tax=Tabachnickia sp. DVL-2014 TaxID=1569960 RepID=A0A0N7ALI2_9METZ|nr:cytochrome c oxidase subunit 2 [Tabachnickia sp. DVL-2014]
MKVKISLYATMITKKDLPSPWQFSFQDPASPIMEQTIKLHDYYILYLLAILGFISWILTTSIKNSVFSLQTTENTTIETIWTIIPAIILITIAYPSLKLLYLSDEITEPSLTIKITGHQWYWNYEYSDYKEKIIKFNSYMIPSSDLNVGNLRLLEVDKHLIIPTHTNIRILVTAADVLHSFTVPSLGIKIDAIPGRLNQTSFISKRPGIFYGQCSELCGANHSFMPIVIETTSLKEYTTHILSEITSPNE